MQHTLRLANARGDFGSVSMRSASHFSFFRGRLAAGFGVFSAWGLGAACGFRLLLLRAGGEGRGPTSRMSSPGAAAEGSVSPAASAAGGVEC